MCIVEYIVYVLDDNDEIFDTCGEFNSLVEAQEYIDKLKMEDAKNLMCDEYAIYVRLEARL